MVIFQAWDFSGWKMVIFRVEFDVENGLFLGWNLPWKMAIFQGGVYLADVSLFRAKSHPGKWPFSARKMAIFHA